MPQNTFWLALDLSGAVGTVALVRASGELVEQGTLPVGQHSENLLPEIERLLNAHGVSFSEVERFLTCNGPGSFTGLRVAFAALKAFVLANKRPIESLDGHEVRALSYLATQKVRPAKLDVVTQLTRDRFLLTEFTCSDRIAQLSQEIVTDYKRNPLRLVDKPEMDGIYFGLQARFLAEQLQSACSRQTLDTTDAIVNASPEYFGARFT